MTTLGERDDSSDGGRSEGRTERCIGCGAATAKREGPTHRYLGASPGCWGVYGNVLAKEYSDVRYGSVHALTVDAYALQHPGTPSPQTIQSAAVHLISLYLSLEEGLGPRDAARAKQLAKDRLREEFRWLDPPADRGGVTVVDVEEARDAEEHEERVEEWARSVWDAWSPHHKTVREWVARLRDDG